MKLLVVNPNSSETVTRAIMESARRAAAPTSELIPVTAHAGPRNIDCAYGDYMAGHQMLAAARDAVDRRGPDAIVLAVARMTAVGVLGRRDELTARDGRLGGHRHRGGNRSI